MALQNGAKPTALGFDHIGLTPVAISRTATTQSHRLCRYAATGQSGNHYQDNYPNMLPAAKAKSTITIIIQRILTRIILKEKKRES